MKILKEVADCKILVVGDIMLDKYVVGTVDRISPEAPVQVVNVFDEFSTLGGCGNVISNLRELGASVSCISRIGSDIPGYEIIQKISNLNVEDFIVRDPNIKTTLKERIVANHRMTQLVRVDRESLEKLDPKKINYDFNYEDSIERTHDIIIVSDYNKGVITKGLFELLNTTKIPIIVDPKPANSYLYDKVFMITPNDKEYQEMFDNQLIQCEYILRTLGRDGMQLINEEETVKIQSTPVDVYNVSGAGDTVVAVMSLCIAMGINVIDSAKISNEAARYVVQQPGTSVVPKDIFNKILKKGL